MYKKLLGDGNEETDETTMEVCEEDSSETSLVVYRDRMVARIVDQTEDALIAAASVASLANDAASSSSNLPSTEMREKLTRVVSFLLKHGAVYPLDLIRFLTIGPNPRRFCFLPEDRLFEMTAELVQVGLRDKALLSVMFHDNLKVFTHPVSKITENLEFLRGQTEGLAMSENLSTVLIDCPSLLADLDRDDWRERKEWFDHNFTARSFREFLITQPAVLHEPLRDIEEKFL